LNLSLWTFNLLPGDAISNYIRALANILQEKHPTRILFYEVGEPEQGLIIDRFPSDLARIPIFGTRLAAMSLTGQDVTWLNYPHYYGGVGVFRKKRAKTKILDFHGVTPPNFYPLTDRLRPLLVRGEIELPSTVKVADFYIAHSNYMADVLKANGASDVETVYYPLNLDAFSMEAENPKDEALIDAFGLKDAYPILLSVGRLVGNKGLDVIVKALKLIKNSLPRVKLLLVGDYVNNLEVYFHLVSLAEQLGIRKDVIFAGRSKLPQLARFYRLADVYLCASYHEGFCIPLAEAMAAGIPVVASNCTAIPETLGDAGVLFEPGDFEALAESTKEVLNDAPLRSKLVAAGRERARQFSHEKFNARVNDILSKLSI